MSATRKLYIELAATIRIHADLSDNSIPDYRHFVSGICGDLKQDNMNFDSDKFKTACGL